MAHSLLATSAVVMIGFLAARIGDRLRTPLVKKNRCPDAHVWSYNLDASQSQDAWLPVRPAQGPCA